MGGTIALVASHGAQAGWWDYATGLEILAPGFGLGLAGVGSGGLWLVRALSGNNSAYWKLGAPALAGSLLLAGIPLNQARLYLVSPPIHDVSTDVEYAPPFVALLPLRAGAENGPDYDGPKRIEYGGKRTTVALAQKKAYPDIKSYVALLNPRQDPDILPVKILFWRGFERAKDMGWNVVYFSEAEGRIEATDDSIWFGRVADISIRVKPAGKIGARLDIRAKSRTGENDMAFTAQIVRGYLKALR
ncbi:MAG: DUF1499 domain-containing protein [Rhizomicrobium sp.]